LSLGWGGGEKFSERLGESNSNSTDMIELFYFLKKNLENKISLQRHHMPLQFVL
jgi:hypothetical protein